MGNVVNKTGEFGGLESPQGFQGQAFAPVAGGGLDLGDAEDQRHNQRQRQRDIGDQGGEFVDGAHPVPWLRCIAHQSMSSIKTMILGTSPALSAS